MTSRLGITAMSLLPAPKTKLWLCAVAVVVASCGGVQIKPEPDLPAPLLTPLPAKIGLVLPDDVRNYKHQETRWGVNWEIDLGPGHSNLVRELFDAEFGDIVEFTTLDEARRAQGLKGIFEPRIEQYSFATARETGGRHYAVTIRYRINLYTPEGIPADSYTLTGYGNALAKGMSSGGPLQLATLAAMRDAAAKFLVQFPDQPAGKKLAQNDAVVPQEKKTASAGDSTAADIEAVPVDEPETQSAAPEPETMPPEELPRPGTPPTTPPTNPPTTNAPQRSS